VPASPPRTTLLTGGETVLVDRAVRDVLDAVRMLDAEAERREIDAEDPAAAGALREALGPTLFGTSVVVVVSALDRADDATAVVIRDALLRPGDHAWLVLHHPGGNRGAALLKEVKAAGADVVSCAEIRKGRALTDFLTAEFTRHGRRASREALAMLSDAVGHDVGLLAAAVAQLSADVVGDPIGVDEVGRYFAGVAEATGFQVSDAVWERRPVDALRLLRWAQGDGDAARIGPLMVAAVASGMRGLVRLAGAPPGLPDAQLAKEAGVPEWKLRALRSQLARWRPEQFAAATVRLMRADAAVKGGLREREALDAAQKGLVLDRMVIDTAARGREG
jgi:DNA polymerase III subunit delta